MEVSTDLYATSQRRLIASLLYRRADEDVAEELAPILSSLSVEDFDDPAMAAIYRSINRVVGRSEDPTPTTIAAELERAGNLGKIGGLPELYELRREGREARLEAPAFFYAEEVKKGAVRRSVKVKLEETTPLLKSDSGKAVTEVVGSLANDLNAELNRMVDKESVGEISEAIPGYKELLKERKERSEASGGESNGGLQGIITPLPTLNKYTAGWLPGQLITVAARPGVGKSIFGINTAVAAASAGASVLLFSLEMGEEEVVDRVISSVTQVSQSRLKSGYVSSEDLQQIEAYAEDIRSLKITVDTNPRVTLSTIRAKALQAKQSPAGLDLIIVDYIQLIADEGGKAKSRQEIVADISREMKLLAKQLKIPIMAIAQLNRAGAGDENNPLPTMENIRESDAISQNSDIVILLHRDKESFSEGEIPKTKFILAKNRNGPADRIITCSSFLSTSTFQEAVKESDSILESDEDVDALLDDGLDEDFEDFDDLGWED